jgi:hypothetical protein
MKRRDAQGDRDTLRHAAELTVRACELGISEAYMETGILFEAGEHVPQDDDAKLRYLGTACDRGRAEACLYLAQDAAERGASEREVERLDRRACELGNIEACDDAVRRAAARHDDDAVRFATEGCRMGGDDGCKELIARDTALPAVPHDRQLHDYREVCNAGHAPACEQLARLEAADAASMQSGRSSATRPPPGSEIGGPRLCTLGALRVGPRCSRTGSRCSGPGSGGVRAGSALDARRTSLVSLRRELLVEAPFAIAKFLIPTTTARRRHAEFADEEAKNLLDGHPSRWKVRLLQINPCTAAVDGEHDVVNVEVMARVTRFGFKFPVDVLPPHERVDRVALIQVVPVPLGRESEAITFLVLHMKFLPEVELHPTVRRVEGDRWAR